MKTRNVLDRLLESTDETQAAVIADLLTTDDLFDNCDDLVRYVGISTEIETIWKMRILPAYTKIKSRVDKIGKTNATEGVIYDNVKYKSRPCLHGQIEWRDYFLMALIALEGRANE